MTRFSFSRPHQILFCGIFLYCFPVLLSSQQSSQPYVLLPDIALKAMIRDVLFSNTKPSVRNTGLFERIFLPQHISPKNELLVPEFLFAEGEEVPPSYIVQTSQNLIWSKMFRTVKFSFDTTIAKRLDVFIDLEERPNIVPFLVAETGSGVAAAGAGVDIVQLGGTATSLRAAAQYRTLNGIGWQGTLDLETRRVWEWLNFRVHLLAHQFRNEQELVVQIPYSLDSPYFEMELAYSRAGGQEFVYQTGEGSRSNPAPLLESAKFNLSAFESNQGTLFGAVRGWSWDYEFYLLGRVALDVSSRGNERLRRVSDNSFQAHVGLALERQRLEVPTSSTGEFDWSRLGTPMQGWYLHSWLGAISTPLVQWRGGGVGNWIFRGGARGFLGNKVYAGVDAEMSLFPGGTLDAIIFNSFSFARFHAYAAFPLGSEAFLAARFLADANHPLVRPFNGIGQESWIRGFGANTLFYTGKLLFQMDVRGLPIAEVGVFRLRGALFADIGTFNRYEQMRPFWQFNDFNGIVSCGAGLRLHYPSFAGGEGTLRVDVAYLPILGRFGQLIIATQEAFSLFEDFPAKQARILNEQRWIE